MPTVAGAYRLSFVGFVALWCSNKAANELHCPCGAGVTVGFIVPLFGALTVSVKSASEGELLFRNALTDFAFDFFHLRAQHIGGV